MWPKHFPEGCPSQTTPAVNGEAYRLVKKATGMIPKDWDSHAQRCPNGCDYCAGKPECQRVSLSVLSTLEDARASLAQLNKFNKRYGGIARASLKPVHGKMTQTGHDLTHYSLWLTAAALEHVCELFALIKPEES
jgi:hypothetical protein